MASKIYNLDDQTVYIKDRNCVIRSNNIHNLPDEVLPSLISHDTVDINRELTTELIILLSYRCNLQCIYCSNNSGVDSNASIQANRELYEKAIAHVIQNAVLLQKLNRGIIVKPARIIISGGGEPTIEWADVKNIVEVISKYKNKYGQAIAELWILTNAQLDEKKVYYLMDNFDNISVSCDGYSIQDQQRPRKDKLSSKKFVESLLNIAEICNKKIIIRMTVTGDGLFTLLDDVETFFSQYHIIQYVIIEPYAYVGRGVSSIITELKYDDFLAVFDQLARKYYGRVGNSASILNTIPGYPCNRLAGISFVVSPYGALTCCDTVTPESTFWDKMIIAEYNGNRIKVTKKYYYELPGECFDCIASLYCNGGCPMHVAELDSVHKEAYCSYIRKMFISELLRRIEISNKAKHVISNNELYAIYNL